MWEIEGEGVVGFQGCHTTIEGALLVDFQGCHTSHKRGCIAGEKHTPKQDKL